MGSKLGVYKVAAGRIGIGLDEYLENIKNGLKWCWKCESWKPISEFGIDRSRGDGHKSVCADCDYARVTNDGPGMIER